MTPRGEVTDERSSRWRWANLPIPEPHVAGVLAGIALHHFYPWPITAQRHAARIRRRAGVVCVLGGVLGIAWSVRTVGEAEITRPSTLVTTGPYAVSRNPMYVAWTVLYTGIGLLRNTVWTFVLLPAVVVTSHRIVRREERSLERTFGAAYRDYRRDVRRYC